MVSLQRQSQQTIATLVASAVETQRQLDKLQSVGAYCLMSLHVTVTRPTSLRPAWSPCVAGLGTGTGGP